MPIDIPTIRIAPSANWEITLPRSALFTAGLSQVSLTDKGLYIEDFYGRYDLIPFDELAMLLEDGAETTVSPILPSKAHLITTAADWVQ